MKLFYAQKDDRVICIRCRATLKRGEVFVRTGYKKEGNWGFLFYHPECYINMIKDKLTRKFIKFKEETNPPKRRGRQSKFRNPEKAQQLRCLLNYHRKLEHWNRVAELEIRLKELEIDKTQ